MTSFAANSLEERTASLVIPDNPVWLSNPWTISKTTFLGVAKQDTLRLRANGTIEIQKSNSKKSTLWATSCLLTCAGLSGVTLDNRRFLITFNSATGEVTCTIPPLPPSQAARSTQSQGHDGHDGHKPGSDGTWVAEEGGPGTVEPPPSESSGTSKG